jgi:hypothetical protein
LRFWKGVSLTLGITTTVAVILWSVR